MTELAVSDGNLETQIRHSALRRDLGKTLELACAANDTPQ